jgi:hypothetical protein
VDRPYADRQRVEKYRHKLSGTPLEKTVRDADLFGKTAHAKFVICGHDYTDQWDYICSIDNYVIAKNAPIDPGRVFKGTKFGLMVDDTHITRTSALYPCRRSRSAPQVAKDGHPVLARADDGRFEFRQTLVAPHSGRERPSASGRDRCDSAIPEASR